MSRWMGSQLNGRIDYNEVVFSIGLMESHIFESLGVRNSGKLKWEDSRLKKSQKVTKSVVIAKITFAHM